MFYTWCRAMYIRMHENAAAVFKNLQKKKDAPGMKCVFL